MSIGVYKITSPTDKVYIGQSANIEKRFRNYKNIYNCKNQKRLLKSFIEFGVDNHLFEIIEICPENDLLVRERFWQDYFDCIGEHGLNLKLTSLKNKRAVYSQESRDKMSLSRTGPKNHMFGKKGENSPSFGKKQSAEQKSKYSVRKGVKKSEIHKQRIGLPQIGGGNHQAKLVIDLQTGIFYGSVIEAATAKGINRYTLSDYLNNKAPNKTSFKFA